jgi:alpha-galactosidase
MRRIITKSILGIVSAALWVCTVPADARKSDTSDPLAPTGRWSANVRGNAQTPPMGWNSWNAFRLAIDEAKVIGTASALIDTGLASKGYRYVNIDDGWWLKRRQSDGRILIQTSMFPSARTGGPEDSSFRPFTDRLHGMGLKAGIYTDIGRNSCGQSFNLKSPNSPEGSIAEREIGTFGHAEKDANLFFKEWGFDYVKVDACGIDNISENARVSNGGNYRGFAPLIDRDSLNRTDVQGVKSLYRRFGAAIAAANPDGDYIYSLCNWGSANVRAWGKDVGNLVRTSYDSRPIWSRMLHIFDTVATRPLYAQPGSWNDPDMLEIGHGDFDENHLTEARSHFSLWAISNAPLLIGFDIREAPKALLDVLGNEDLIKANQDKGGHQAVLAYSSEDVQIFVKTLAGTDRKVVAIFNRGIARADVELMANHLKFADDAEITLRDLWSKEILSPFTGKRKFDVAPRETMVFEVSGTRSLSNGYYLSELPGRINVAHDGVVVPVADPTIHHGMSPWTGSRTSGERPIYGGWGGAQADATPYSQQIGIAGIAFDTGIGILANSRLEVKNDREYTRFSAQVGVDQNSHNIGDAITFQIYADGKLVASSKPLRFGDKPFDLTADIAGAGIVELVVRQKANTDRPVTAAWGNAAISARVGQDSF